MNYEFDSRFGEQLYHLLPEVYRTRDKITSLPDLAKYLDANGYLLDLIYATLQRQLQDIFPTTSQDWLVPYFARLLAVDVISPDSEGRHAEIDNAISWRQRKGTLSCAEEIAEKVGQMEVQIQEGWKRVAMTPSIGMPLMPIEALDSTLKIEMNNPHQAMRHPGLPTAMIDLRWMSRAIRAEGTNPAARISNFRGENRTWRQVNYFGTPCFPNSFDDVSHRTVDMRTPDARKGHYHHKRLLAYAPPPTGIFPHSPITKTWKDAIDEKYIETQEEFGVQIYSNNTDRVLVIRNEKQKDDATVDEVKLDEGKNYKIENIHFTGRLELADGKLELDRVVAKEVQVNSSSTDAPVLLANDSLFEALSVGSGVAKLERCTVLDVAYLYDVKALDCIFTKISGTEITGSIEYSRIPEETSLSSNTNKISIKSHHLNKDGKYGYDLVTDLPLFLIKDQDSITVSAVLSPNTPKSIYAGARDGGEMGFYNRGRKNRPVRIKCDFVNNNIQKSALNLKKDGGYPLSDVVIEGRVEVESGAFKVVRSAIYSLTVKTHHPLEENPEKAPRLFASDCLFDEVKVDDGLARLEYCTVMIEASCKHLQASDCIFAGLIRGVSKPVTNKTPPSFFNCIRYSTIPQTLIDEIGTGNRTSKIWKVAETLRLIDQYGKISLGSNTVEKPVFTDFDYCEKGQSVERMPKFGDLDYGVLDQVTSDAIRFGAEDGGEMGACHRMYYSLKAEAMLNKMREYLPIGMESVLIQDTHLLHVPPVSE